MTDGSDGVDPLSSERPVYEVDVPVTALLKLAGVLVVSFLLLAGLSRAQQLVGIAIAAAVVAAVIGPAIRAGAQLIGGIASTIVVHVILLLVVAGSTVLVVQSIRAESTALEDYTAVQLERLDEDGGPTFLTRTRLDERIGDTVTGWGVGAVVGDDDATGIATRMSELVLLVVFSAFFSVQGGALLTMALGWIDDRDRRRVLREIWQEGVERGASFTRRAGFVAVVSGLGASAVALAFGLPAALLIGVAAGLLSIVPLLGPVVGWLPLVVIAAVDREPREVAAVAVVAVAGVIAVGLLRARVLGHGFSPGLLLVALGLAAGLSAGGLPGAMCGMFLAVFAASALGHDWTVERIAGMRGVTAPLAHTSEFVRTAESDEADTDFAPLDAPVNDRRLLLQPTNRTLWRITGIVLAAFSLQLSITRIGPTIIWAVVGILIAIGLDRPVSWLERRWGIRRSLTVALGALLVVGALAGLAFSASESLGGSSKLDTDLAAIQASFEDLPLIGDRIADLDLSERIDEFERDVPNLMSSTNVSERVAPLVGGGLVGGFWILVVAMACLIDGPKLVVAIDRRVPARLRRQTERLARAGHSALSGYVAGSATVAALNGFIVASMGFAVGVPAPAVLGIWAFSWNFVPQIGAIIGWVPMLVLAFLVSPLAGVVCLGLFVGYQLVENNLIQPAIVGHAVDITPLAALTAALVGVAVAGLVGAVLAIPAAGVVRAVYNEWRREDFPAIRPPVVDSG
ncbi:AI-2E family transporter [Ilumatobacter nonamiensis]|uniref:AI-2E family transporter n=1 Tax=Ilumatobacter nonamiensis TaxID=467093 RepID=UPI00130D7BBC|nr:AI-2E family transporter [Ilumatobacter nonamiensis]